MDALVPQEFGIGELVWAKMKFYPPWPALIINPPIGSTVKIAHKYVLFFGGKEHACVSIKNLSSYRDNIEEFSKVTKVNFRIALSAIEKYERSVQKKRYRGDPTRKIELLKELLCVSSDEARWDLMNDVLQKQDMSRGHAASSDNTSGISLPQAPLSQSNTHILIKREFEIPNETSSILNNTNLNSDVTPIVTSSGSAKDIFLKHNLSTELLKNFDEVSAVQAKLTDSPSDLQSLENNPCMISGNLTISNGSPNPEMSFMPAGEGPSTSTKIFPSPENLATNSTRDTKYSGKEHGVSTRVSARKTKDTLYVKRLVQKKTEHCTSKPIKKKTERLTSRPIERMSPRDIKPNIVDLKKQSSHFQGKIHILKQNGANISSEDSLRMTPIPYPMKIGFIGVGNLGYFLSKTLTEFGNRVFIWNRTVNSAIAELVSLGALYCNTPADVVRQSDMIFCTLRSNSAISRVICGGGYYSNSALDGLHKSDSKKAIIMLSTLCPELSKELSQTITRLGASYLEAPIIPQMMLNTNMCIVTAGDDTLHHRLQECLCCSGAVLYHISSRVGDAILMKQAYTITHVGISLAAIEMMCFARCGRVPFDNLQTISEELKFPQLVLDRVKDVMNEEWFNDVQIFEALEALSFITRSHPGTNFRIAVAAQEQLKMASRLQLSKYSLTSVFKYITPGPSDEMTEQ